MKISETLKAARKLIENPEKWIKGTWQLGDRFCALGALSEVTGESVFFRLNKLPAYKTLFDALPQPKDMVIGSYNDTHEHADILALYDRAITAAEKDEAN